jgi:NADPH-dependent ferric siderophore reductase
VTAARTRREPPAFRLVEVAAARVRTPRLVRLTLAGPALAGLDIGRPAASVRLLLTSPGDAVVVPSWNGNEFRYDDGSRPVIRTVTPLRLDPAGTALDVEIVRHGHGPLSTWASASRPGDGVAVSGTGRGYDVDPDARHFVLAGDESALPAIGVLLKALPPAAHVDVLVEVAEPAARLDLPHPGAAVRWYEATAGAPPGDALMAAIVATPLAAGARLWAAGEAAAMQRIRRHLFGERHVARSHAVVRGYWKQGRAGDGDPDADEPAVPSP